MSNADVEPNEKTVLPESRKEIPAFEQVHLLTYMQLADAKASVFLAIASGAIAYIAGHYGLAWLREEHFFGHSLLLTLTTVVLVVSAALDIAVIVPRKQRHRDGIFFYHDIADIGSPSRYAELVAGMSDAEVLRNQMTYCYALALICNRKYRLLGYSFILGVLGYAMFLGLLLWR